MIETTEIEQQAATKKILPAPLTALEHLSWNYWWSWASDGASIFRDLDPDIWEDCEQNPRQLLSRASDYRLAQVATDPRYLDRVEQISEEFNSYMAPATGWSSGSGPAPFTHENPVAYFCAEYG